MTALWLRLAVDLDVTDVVELPSVRAGLAAVREQTEQFSWALRQFSQRRAWRVLLSRGM
jgi:hypothetical protein